MAVGDGVDYEKFEGNPVLTGKDLPEGGSALDFRDPKIWREPDRAYHCAVGNRTADGSGAILLYESDDGRRIMIAWMQSWTNSNCQPFGARIFGEMTLPRELTVKNGRLIQNPVRELNSYHGHRVAYSDVLVTRETNMQGISGRVLDMTVSVRPAGNSYQWFKLNVAKDGEHVTIIRYKPDCSTVRVDRTRCGIRYDVVHVRGFLVRPQNGAVRLRVVMDRHSLELFVNDGEQAAAFILYTPESADSISFEANGAVLVDVEKYDLNFD